MSSLVYFRFSSSKDFDYISFEGDFISIGELKYLISKKTGVSKDRSTVIELFDSGTEEEYVDTNTMIAKSSSVVAKRSPAVRPPPIAAASVKTPTAAATTAKEPLKNEAAATVEENLDEALGPGVFAPEAKEEADDATISQVVRRFGEVWRTDLNLQSSWRRGRGREFGGRGRRGALRVGRSNLPPPGYVCHRCNTPGHFIEDCPTNGDPAFDFVRVRYPTGIPSSMLEKDEEGGLMLPDGQRARLKPNTEKFKQEMEGVPSGEPSVKRLPGPSAGEAMMGQRFEELSSVLARNPLTTLAPLMMHVLPHGRDDDVRRGFFCGEPFDRQTFQQCREEHMRATAYDSHVTQPPPPNWTQPPPPGPPTYDNGGHWRAPPPNDFYGDRHWTQKGSHHPFVDYGPPRKPPYTEPPPPHWNPHVRVPFYDAGFPQPPPYAADRYAPEPPMTYPTPASESGPSLPSKIVRPQPNLPTEEMLTASNENGRHFAEDESKKDLPYGFERSMPRMSIDKPENTEEYRPTRSRSRSPPNKPHRRRSAHTDTSDRSPSIKRSKAHRRDKERSHHHRRKKDKERRGSRRDVQDRSPALSDREAKRQNYQVSVTLIPIQRHHLTVVISAGRWIGPLGT